MKKLTTLIFLALAVGLVGCADKKSKKPGSSADPNAVPPGATTIDPGAGPWTPTGSGPGTGPGANWDQGASAPLTIVSVNRFEEYVTEPRNNPQNIRINLNLSKIGSNTYGGSATIAYEDYMYSYQGDFTSGSSKTDNKYNVWLQKDGKTAFHAFFEDGLGAIIVVLDDFEIIDGDGGKIGETIGGKVYFKNFDPNSAPEYAYYYPGYSVKRAHCWFISLGPNDCRAWKDGSGVDTYKAIYPDSGYQLLGTFSGMNVSEAFNGDVEFNF